MWPGSGAGFWVRSESCAGVFRLKWSDDVLMLKETFRFWRYDCSGVFVRMMMLRVRTMKRLQRFSVNFLIMCSAATSPVLCVCLCMCQVGQQDLSVGSEVEPEASRRCSDQRPEAPVVPGKPPLLSQPGQVRTHALNHFKATAAEAHRYCSVSTWFWLFSRLRAWLLCDSSRNEKLRWEHLNT